MEYRNGLGGCENDRVGLGHRGQEVFGEFVETRQCETRNSVGCQPRISKKTLLYHRGLKKSVSGLFEVCYTIVISGIQDYEMRSHPYNLCVTTVPKSFSIDLAFETQ